MRIVVALLLAAMFAGCAGNEAPAEPTQNGPTPKEVETSSDLGAISGVVVDETIAPIMGATATLLNHADVLVDDEGGFVFEALAPGVYFIEVTAAGYAPVQTSATVSAGEATKLRVLMTSAPSIDPIHYTLKFDGFIQFSAAVGGGLLNILLDGLGLDDPTCTCNLKFDTDGENVTTFVAEASWAPTISDPTPFCPDCLYFSFSDSEFNGAETAFLPSPIYQAMPREQFPAASVEWDASLTGNGYWINMDQKYEMFITVFSNAPAPEGWSLIEGDE